MRPAVALAALALAAPALAACTGSAASTSTAPPPVTVSPDTVSPDTMSPENTAPAATATVTTTEPPTTRIDEPLDAAGYADELSRVELVIRDPASTDAAVVEAGVRMQLLLRSLAARPEFDGAVVAALHADVRPTIERLIVARQFLQARAAADPDPAPPSPTLPAWTIVEPEPVDELLGRYGAAEAATGVPWYWLAAIHLQETRMGRIVGVSSAGAVGPMQFLPSTWESCCTGDPTVTADAILGAATYLAQSGAPADMTAALHQYNPNDGYVAQVTAYAENLREVPALYRGYHAWQVFVGTAAGTVRLPVGYAATEPVDAAAYVAAHPGDAG